MAPKTDHPLDKRTAAILLQVVSEFIQNAEPVGSRSIAKKYVEKLSPATIRTVMADLEDLGYLHQPHTSAGRIPTDRGYRYFVDQLGKLEPTEEQQKLAYDYSGKTENLEDVLEAACENLSKISNQTGLVMLPPFSITLFKHIEFIKVGSNQALVVFFSDIGVLQKKIIPIDKDLKKDELTSISNYLNEEFSGCSIKAIRLELLRRLRHEKEHYNRLMRRAMEIAECILTEEKEHPSLLIEGSLNILNQPEFSADLENIKTLLKTLEEKKKLIRLLDQCLEQDGMTIFIGGENVDEEMRECSLIAQNYGQGGTKLGTVAVFGPKRMDYKKNISVVNQTAMVVSKIISERSIGV